MSKKIAYSKLTFILSVIGFLGSLGFYIGVLREVYADPQHKQSPSLIELKEENKELKKQITVLTRLIESKDE